MHRANSSADRGLRCTTGAGALLFLVMAGAGHTLHAQEPAVRPDTTAHPAVRAAVAPLTLARAIQEADGHAFGNRVATAAVAAERARARLARKGLLPSARVESGIVRTTDPVSVFGTTLRQRLVTPTAFDPTRLNNPSAVTNVQGGLVVELPLLNVDVIAGGAAARAMADATDASAVWTMRVTRATVVRAYYGAVLAAERVTVVAQARRAVDAAATQVQAMMQQGLVTRADVLQAQVRATELASQLIAVRNDARTAEQQLALLLGRTDGETPVLPTALPDDAVVRALAARDTLGAVRVDVAMRADVAAARATANATNADRRRAMATLLPRVNSFARYDWNAASALYAGKPSWTVGVMASWSPFSGGAEFADVAGATARATSARVGEDAVRSQARLDADIARRDIIVALERLDLAQQVAEQSREAHRLVEKRYAGGLATLAELLGAESTATGAAMARATARFSLIESLAVYRRAIGADPAELTVLDEAH